MLLTEVTALLTKEGSEVMGEDPGKPRPLIGVSGGGSVVGIEVGGRYIGGKAGGYCFEERAAPIGGEGSDPRPPRRSLCSREGGNPWAMYGRNEGGTSEGGRLGTCEEGSTPLSEPFGEASFGLMRFKGSSEVSE